MRYTFARGIKSVEAFDKQGENLLYLTASFITSR